MKLLLLLWVSSAFAQQGIVASYIRLPASSLPAICKVGDMRTSGGILNYCSPANTWGGFTVSSTSPMTTLGDIIVEDATPTAIRLAGNTTATKMYLSQTGNGAISALPAWAQISTADLTGTLAIGHGGTGQVTAAAAFNALSPMTNGGDLIYGGASGVGTRLANGTAGQLLQSNGTTLAPTWVAAPTGTVTSVAMSVPGSSILTVTGSPVTTSGTLGLVTTGTSGGVPYFSSTSQLTSSALLTTNQPILGGGAGGAPVSLVNGTAGQPLLSAGTTLAPTYGTLGIAAGGTGQVTKAAAFDALQPMSAGGDLIYGGASGTGTRLPNGSAGQVLTSQGTTLAPHWAAAAGGAPNYQISSSSGTFSSGSGTYTAVTNLSVTITVTGNPVVLMLVPDGDTTSGHECQFQVDSSSETGAASLEFLEGSTVIGQYRSVESDSVISTVSQYLPCSSINHFYVPSAGTYTYTVKGKVTTGSAFSVIYAKLVAYELH